MIIIPFLGWATVLAIFAAAASAAPLINLGIRLWEILPSRYTGWRARSTLRERLGAEAYDRDEIARATTYYVEPDFQSVDPSGGEDIRRVVSAREPLFDATDRILENTSEYRYILVLADSGMGKTSFVLNYYAHHWRNRKRRNRFTLELVPLNLQDADKFLESIPRGQRSETVLFLDALDEDRRAIANHRDRIEELMKLTAGFRTVLLTCRTQFFPRDEEIPLETGHLKFAPTKAGDSKALYFHKLYLAPFSDEQVESYLRRRFPRRRVSDRKRAAQIIKKVPDLVARPMLLAHVDDLVARHDQLDEPYQIYEEMIDAWLERERAFVKEKDKLRKFSELLAVDLFVNRRARDMERIPEHDLEPLANRHGIDLKGWQLRTRSLLNRDGSGNYKFAHRSFMEYLLAKQFVEGSLPMSDEPWTDLMKAFAIQMVRSKGSKQLRHADLSGISLAQFDMSGMDLTETNLQNSMLDGSTLGNADLSSANLKDAFIRGADCKYAKLRNCNLSNADLSRANCRGADFTGATLKDAKVSGAILRDAQFEGVKFVDADLRGVNFNGANLRKADMTNADLSGAILTDADLTGAILTGANLHGATGIKLSAAGE